MQGRIRAPVIVKAYPYGYPVLHPLLRRPHRKEGYLSANRCYLPITQKRPTPAASDSLSAATGSNGNVRIKTADLTTVVKLFFNNVISTQNARFMIADLKDFYLEPPMEE
jgi:hypothetical protein